MLLDVGCEGWTPVRVSLGLAMLDLWLYWGMRSVMFNPDRRLLLSSWRCLFRRRR